MTADPVALTIAARSKRTHARLGRVDTPHGGFDTPAFMPVGTRGTVKGILPEQVRQGGAQILLNNTYHLMLRPGSELIEQLGGVHAFMGWDAPILTDSGGFQAYSMADINAVDDDGVRFKSIVDGSTVHLGPESAMRVQNELGADIIMAFDDCPPAVDPSAAPDNLARLRQASIRPKDYDHDARLRIANERTIRWLDRCKRAHAKPSDQALFGIVQGGTDHEHRRWSLERVCNIDLPGYAIGGVAVGESSEQIAEIVQLVGPKLPESKPRYLMGVGYERDLLSAVLGGVDMFDCVLPTRNGRNASAFTATGSIRLKNAKFREDPGPIDPACDCQACTPAAHGWQTPDGKPFSRGYIRHLFLAGEMLGPILVSLHNLRHFQRFMLDVRGAIENDAWQDLAAKWPVIAPVLGSAVDRFGEPLLSPARP